MIVYVEIEKRFGILSKGISTILISLALTLYGGKNLMGQDITDMELRLNLVKKSTVQICVNGQPSGSGFVVTKDGLIATNFHVVQNIQSSVDGQVNINYASSIEVIFNDGKRLPASVYDTCKTDSDFMEALSKDYCILKVTTKDLTPLTVGSFADAKEGAKIYLCGFPLGIGQPVVSVGMLSTKWVTAGYLDQGGDREVAWLDITMNKGNSGGPIVLFGKDVKDDQVIGIASFGLNPFAKPSEELIQLVQTFPGTARIIGVDFKRFSILIGAALASNSLGVGGCVSIDYLKCAAGLTKLDKIKDVSKRDTQLSNISQSDTSS